MASVKFGIGVVGVMAVAFANVATTWAQSDEVPRRLRERISRTRGDVGSPSAGGAFDTEVKLTAKDASIGNSVAISGDTAIGVDVFYTNLESMSGAVYVYRRNSSGGEAWSQVTKITASDGTDYDEYGSSVAISGDTAIVGARLAANDFGFQSGAAYVYRKDEGGKDNWGEVTKITLSDELYRSLGTSVAVSGDTVVVGAVRDGGEGTSSGLVYVYRRDEGGKDNWGEVSKITASDGVGYIRFGKSLAICGDTAIVGASWDDDNGELSGSAYVYQRDTGGKDNWGEVTKLIGSDVASRDFFGASVAISGDTAIAGAPHWSEPFTGSESAYVFQRDEGGADNWGEVTKITASDGADSDGFGENVAICGDTAIVGASFDDDSGLSSGSVYAYSRNEGGKDNWGEMTKITASDAEARHSFGRSVAISNDTAIVGGGGAAYVYFEACLDDAACADGDACNGAETCNPELGRCLAGTPIECDDGDECNGVESCEPQTGDCIDGAINDCDDNGIDDPCDLADCGGDPGCDDCDGNGSLDRCDIAAGQPDANGNGQLDQCEPPCTDNASCDDSDTCSFDRCIDDLCRHNADALYGDVAGEAGVCGPDGDVNLSDILAVLDGFAGQFADGCELVNIDVAGDAGSCVPNGIIDLSDILGVLDAFQGSDNCCVNAR